MDYAYYPQQAQAYQFNAFPPTPTHSYEAQDDPMTDAQDVYHGVNDFAAFGPTFPFATNGFLPQQTQQQSAATLPPQQHSPPNSNHRHSIASNTPIDPTNGAFPPALNGDGEINEGQSGSRSDSEEKEPMSAQQSRRKAQNRAAQRAFRERKERHVKELETKLNALSAHSSNLLSDNERMRKEIQRLATQNEILKATAAAQPQPALRPPSPVPGPQTYSPTDFASAVGVDLHGRPISYEQYDGEEGQRILAAGATWDLIQSHDLYRRGMVDISEVCRRLKGKAACDGRGPCFKEGVVIRAIEESALSGSDELI